MMNNEDLALKSSQYPIDVIVLEGGRKRNVSSTQTIQETIYSMSPLVQDGTEDVPVVVTSQGEPAVGKLDIKPGNLSHYLDFTQSNFDRYFALILNIIVSILCLDLSFLY